MEPDIAIVIPYCNRAEHLEATLPILLAYDSAARPWVIVVEQLPSSKTHEMAPFNRGLLCNLGAALALDEIPDLEFVCFHDVDLQPVILGPEFLTDTESDNARIPAIYEADEGKPASLVGQVKKRRGWEDTPPGYFGGVVVFTAGDVEKCGGYSNQYWGWGDEDIDLRMRCEQTGLDIEHRDSRFLHLDHPVETVRKELLDNHRRLGKTQDRLIPPETDGIKTLPPIGAKRTDETRGDILDRITKTTRISYPIDREQIEKLIAETHAE